MANRSINVLESLGITIPIIQAPMAAADTPELAIAVGKAGGLGSMGCALLSADDLQQAWRKLREQTNAPVNLNFFCHKQYPDSQEQQEKWKTTLLPYYDELELDIDSIPSLPARTPFNEELCEIVEKLRPPVISFHFGLPAANLVARVKRAGCLVMSSATTVKEAVWLEENGCDVIIAQGSEAGGHRGMFLSEDLNDQAGLKGLLSAILKNVSLPVVAAGGICDAQGIRNALAAGAIAVQMGTAYLFTPEAKVLALHLKALATNRPTAITNIFTGRPARAIINRFIEEAGPISKDAPDFPYASTLVTPLRQASQKADSLEFLQMWAGTNRRPHEMDAETFTRAIYQDVLEGEKN